VRKSGVQVTDRMAEVSFGLDVPSGALASVLSASGSCARSRCFAAQVRPAEVGAGSTVVHSGGSSGGRRWCPRSGRSGGRNCRRASGRAGMLQGIVEIISMVEVGNGLDVACGTGAAVVVADRRCARSRRFAGQVRPAVVGAGSTVVQSGGAGGY
jgi:hypothetical protein